jgi:hypothetical protein
VAALIAVLRPALVTFLGALTLGIMFGVGSSRALEEPKVYRGVLVLEGKIIRGDYDKLRNFLATKSNFDKISGGVFVASPGGDVAEAMKIGHLIRALQLSTDAPSGPPTGVPKFGESVIKSNNLADPRLDYQCVSACFFIYVSGIYRNVNWAGRLGIHRPSPSENDLKKLSSDQVTNLDNRLHRAIENYLREMNVLVKYVDLMFSVSPSAMRWITQDELDSDLQGFIPALKDVVDAKCNSATAAAPSNKEEIALAAANRQSELVKCQIQVQTQLRNELPIQAWHKVFDGK